MKLINWQSTKNTIKDITEAAIIKAVQNDYHALTMTNAIPIQLVYFIQFMLEDIRVTFRHDLNLDLGGVFIDAKDGDISMIPRNSIQTCTHGRCRSKSSSTSFFH